YCPHPSLPCHWYIPSSPPFFLSRTRQPPRPPPVPYTTLFRSGGPLGSARMFAAVEYHGDGRQLLRIRSWPRCSAPAESATIGARSEEHTSELQSRFDLVCRLLLEEKKTPLSYTAYNSLVVPYC